MTDIPGRPVRRVRAGQVRLAFRVWNPTPAPGTRPGAAAAPPVVMLHGLGDDSSVWEPVAAALTPSCRVYALDLRGHGASDWTGPYTAEQLTADLAAFLDALGLRSAAIVGHSAGAALACLFAARHPERVTRIVLEEPAPPFRAAPLTASPAPDPPADEDSGESPADPPSFDPDAAALGEELSGPPPSWNAALSDIKSPALLIASAPADEMASLMGDCELTTIEGDPPVHATRTAEFTDAVGAFLGGPAA